MMLNNGATVVGKAKLRLAAIIIALAAALMSPLTQAHDINITGIARLFLDESSPGSYRLSVADRQVPPLFNIERILPERCSGLPPGRFSYRFECSPALNIDDQLVFPWNFQGVVIVAKWNDGSDVSAYFPSEGDQISASLSDLKAGAGSVSSLARRYLLLGAEHILFGIDHLLFVLGLLLLLKSLKMLIATITAFTIAHSLTLGAAVLGIFPVPGPPIETLIALSIVFLAREIIMGQRGIQTLTHAKPWLVAFGFGLIHGFGFAGALGELGLAQQDIPLALLFFNLGVEAGQIAFIAVLVVAARITKHLVSNWTKFLEQLLAYGLGSVAFYWFAERLPVLFLV